MRSPSALAALSRARPLRLAVIGLLGSACFATPAAAAAAAPVAEVVSRASGAQGWAPLLTNPWPGAVTSDGRYSVFSLQLPPTTPQTAPATPLYVRDVSANVTHEIVTKGLSYATGVDRADRFVSFVTDQGLVAQDKNSQVDLYLLDLKTGLKTLVSRDSGLSSAAAGSGDGLIAGDGKSVVFTTTARTGYAAGVWRRDLTTNVTTKLSGPLDVYEELRSLTDDGRSFTTAGLLDSSGSTLGTVRVGTTRLTTPTEPRISPDGRYAAWTTPSFGTTPALVVRDVAAGTQRSYPVPVTAGRYVPPTRVLWIAPDGSQVAVAAESQAGPEDAWKAQVFTRATGTFAEIADPLGTLLTTQVTGPRPPVVSRTGRFTLVAANGPLFVVDLWGKGLPGGVDLPPATAYAMPLFGFGGGSCEAGDLGFTYAPSPSPTLAPAATTVTVELAGGGETAKATAVPGQPLQLATVKVGPGEVVSVKIAATLAGGKKVNGSWTSTPCQ